MRVGLGAFVSTPTFAGVLPADAHGVSDFMTGGASATLPVHVASALGISGAPALVAEVSGPDPFRLLDAVADVWTVAAAELGTIPRRWDSSPSLSGDRAGGARDWRRERWEAARSASEGDAVLRDWAGHVPIGSGRASSAAL